MDRTTRAEVKLRLARASARVLAAVVARASLDDRAYLHHAGIDVAGLSR